MDKATLIGLILGFGAVFGGQVLEGGKISALLQPTAFIIVIGGTMGATFVSFPISDIIRAVKNASKAFLGHEESEEPTLKQLVDLANKARRNGLITLEEDARRTKDRFLGQGLELMVDGVEAGEIREILEIEMGAFEERNKRSAEIFEAAGGFAPTIGIIGAVLGLIHVMHNLSDTSKLGEGIAVAFVATIYGLMTANIICIPISTKLKVKLKEQLQHREIIIEGLMSILKGINPRMLENKLRGYTLTSGVFAYSGKGGDSSHEESKKKGS